jgi:hypothetical protein
MSDSNETVFRFAADGVDIEFAGTEDFVEKQLVRFRRFLGSAVGVAEAEPAPSTDETSAPKETLDAFCDARPVREGRGAIQDRILLFIYYLQRVQGKREVSGDDITWCFQQRNIPQPKNLHNALGILKRKIGYLQEGSKRGLYSLSPEGISYVDGRFRAR